MKQRLTVLILYLSLILLNIQCGETPITIDERTYTPKIVVEGYLFPGQAVEKIRITRNFPLNRDIELAQIVIADATVRLSDVTTGSTYALSYDPFTFAYHYPGNDLAIDFEKTYRIEINATIDNHNLNASSTTTVPGRGFQIVPEKSRLDPLRYRQRDSQGNLQSFAVAFKRSPTTTFYVMSFVALEASRDNFISENLYGIRVDDIDDQDLNRLKYQSRWVETFYEGFSIHYAEVSWLQIWFYGRYRVILYAGDKNFKDYFLTHGRIQDIDGNLYEPKFHFEGDGIGVFGSALVDTAYFEVIR
ncbi:MAG: DUF4249 domain-containing protein [candidate division KSB1 bacterium]|nr:DUF4249 domain-containing protein [candidate division KSB1 bacterium]MDZ7342581.1 DUF4249 domain-containing protein [candidate division KSB1 bacterium]